MVDSKQENKKKNNTHKLNIHEHEEKLAQNQYD